MKTKKQQTMNRDILSFGRQCLQDEADALVSMIPLMDDSFADAVKLMLHCRGKVIVTGVGKSGHIGAKIAATLSSTAAGESSSIPTVTSAFPPTGWYCISAARDCRSSPFPGRTW